MATPPCPVKNKTSVLLLKFGEGENLIAWQSSPWENDSSAKATQPLYTRERRGKATASPVCLPGQDPGKSEAVPLQRRVVLFIRATGGFHILGPGPWQLSSLQLWGRRGRGWRRQSMQMAGREFPLLLLDTLYFLRRKIFLQRCCLHLSSPRDRPVLRQRFKGKPFIWEVGGGEKGIQYWEEKTPKRVCHSSSHHCGRLGLHLQGNSVKWDTVAFELSYLKGEGAQVPVPWLPGVEGFSQGYFFLALPSATWGRAPFGSVKAGRHRDAGPAGSSLWLKGNIRQCQYKFSDWGLYLVNLRNSMEASLQEASPNPSECGISKRTDRVLKNCLSFYF